MERSVTALAFKGSVTEAIMESKRLKKLFVVYISGEDEVTRRMENTTWIDDKVVESFTKYCILLHISQGSTEAVQFLAIYPITSVPSITVVGCNGLQIWQNGGFITAETLQSAIDKAWLSLHLQETTASILTAALASKKYEPSSSGTSVAGHHEDGGILNDSASTDNVVVDNEVANNSGADKSTNSVDTSQSDDKEDRPVSSPLETVEESPHTGENETPHIADEKLVSTEYKKNITHNQSPPTVGEKIISHIVERKVVSTKYGEDITHNQSALTIGENRTSRSVEEKRVSTEYKDNLTHNQSAEVCDGASIVSRELSGPRTEDAKTEENRKVSVPESNDASLNIRLPNGTSLQQKFYMTSTLREVKAYVSENQASSISSYDLAIPYPRKVFSDQDLSLTLSELGLSSRQALIVVPHRQASGEPRVVNFAREQTNDTAAASSNANDEGYFSYLRRALSYFNPLSYIGGRPSSANETGSDSSAWQYGANPGLQANLRGPGSPYARNPQGQNKPEASNRKNKQPTNTRFGSNIHTLKRDEDDGRFENRNPFWNGNSTQYNGSGDNEDGK